MGSLDNLTSCIVCSNDACEFFFFAIIMEGDDDDDDRVMALSRPPTICHGNVSSDMYLI